MSHNNYTHNNNNTYTIEIAVDPSSAGGTGTTISYDDTGAVYYKMDIVPNTVSTPLFAGNFTIDGVSPTYKWSWNANPIGPTNQSAPIPPHSYYTTQQIQKTLIGQYGPTYPLDNNPIYGPIKFDNSAYVNGGFTTSGKRATWSKIILKEVYLDNNGVEYTADGQTEFASSLEFTWVLNSLPNPNLFNNNSEIPYKIVAYVYIEYNFSVALADETLSIDFDETPPTGGCTDPTADNFNGQVHFDDGSCTYPPSTHSVIIQDLGLVHSNPPLYDDPPFPSQVPSYDGFNQSTLDLSSLLVMPKNLQIGSGATPGVITLANTYLPGEYVNEVVEIDLFQRRQTVGTGNFTTINGVTTEIMETAIAAYNFPIPGSPDSQDFTSSITFLGDAKANLTAANLRIDNYNPDEGATVMRSAYVPKFSSGSYSLNTSAQPQWVPDAGYVDEDGLVPTTIVEWYTEQLDCLQPDGSTFTVGTDGMWAEEVYTASNNTIAKYPGLEWFPARVKLFVQLAFAMPAHDVYLTLDLRHDTKRTDHQFL